MFRLRRIPAARAATLLTLSLAIPYGLLALVVACVFLPAAVTTSINGESIRVEDVSGRTFGALLAAWIVNVILFWIATAVACFFYNVIAGRFGGIELELESTET